MWLSALLYCYNKGFRSYDYCITITKTKLYSESPQSEPGQLLGSKKGKGKKGIRPTLTEVLLFIALCTALVELL